MYMEMQTCNIYLLVLGHEFVIWKSFYKQSPESCVCKCIGGDFED
jgi:hypothetical protein